jgi:hypothetical protein
MTGSDSSARRWTCSRCGMAVGRIDGEQVELPDSWEQCEEGDFCLSCRRERAADVAQEAATRDEASTEERAKARRAGLIEFEVRRTPDLSDNAIARACRTTTAAVTAARERLQLDVGPPAESAGDWAAKRKVSASQQ